MPQATLDHLLFYLCHCKQAPQTNESNQQRTASAITNLILGMSQMSNFKGFWTHVGN